MRAQGATTCYGCPCTTCANSVELPPGYTTIGEASEPCFSCDECRYYDGDGRKRSQWRDACPRYIEAAKVAERRAQAARASFKVIKGGDGHV